ncbi:3-deoxy-D-manno-octulosonic acid transferase [Planctomicrobium sp. SH661]|uniref:3-deoxy-D-manno-octulosonic acid transferase n=1 Tax=Planctomicrobium sp. SH661 TaxID=3448124 RepID=UPI003F5C5AC6
MLSLGLNCCYCLLVILALPMVAWKRVRTGKYKSGWGQKLLGRLPVSDAGGAKRVWLHAVSVGEVLQLRQIVERLQRARPETRIFISTTTETGHAVAKEKFPECDVAFFPLDFSWSVRNALERVKPDLIVLVELELWPNFILAAAARGIPLVLINGRLSARSFRGYSRIRPLVRRLLRCFRIIATQTEEYHERFVKLGASESTTLVTGSIKFDGVMTNPHHPRTLELAKWMGINEDAPVFVAGSTQAPEEAYALEAYSSLRKSYPELRMILVPRHPERGREVAELITRHGFPVLQRSTGQVLTPSSEIPPVGLLDTVGELGACWGLADVAFVGGSFTSRGGQNMLEPAAFGAAVCFGPNTWNFKQIVELLHARQAAVTVNSADELQEFVHRMLQDPAAATAMGERARELILAQQGATDRTVHLLVQVIDPTSCGFMSEAA